MTACATDLGTATDDVNAATADGPAGGTTDPAGTPGTVAAPGGAPHPDAAQPTASPHGVASPHRAGGTYGTGGTDSRARAESGAEAAAPAAGRPGVTAATAAAPAPPTPGAEGAGVEKGPPPYRPLACVIADDGSYAARLAAPGGGDRWRPERWTFDGPEPYAVALPGRQPEDPHAQLLPLRDGRVLILRRAGGQYRPALLYPSGPGTGELPLGAVECAQLALLPPVPGGSTAYALAPGAAATTVWRLVGGQAGPEPVAVVPGHCADGAWLEGTGRLLALNRRVGDGPVKAVAVDLGAGGALTPLLEIADGSNDRLLLADPDSGLLLVRSDAPGADRVGWGVLGSRLPVRFPAALHPGGESTGTAVTVTPFAVQPGQPLLAESCAVALRVEPEPGAGGLPWLAVWRPGWRAVRYLPAPDGWLRTGRFTAGGELRLPYATREVPCGVARLHPAAPEDGPPAPPRRQPTAPAPAPRPAPAPAPAQQPAPGTQPAPGPQMRPEPPGPALPPDPEPECTCGPVLPLGQALAMAGR
ncbi:hypothetical protein JJV70_15475 [Streptomyces sp. JJ66]|uniref:hypothetical protein n=1 Tax=Streptomyces sp. JJ66 TaxID=2803843 RepID=UPI001C5A4434|nr:hypothetical protein [Streptomyces sp. JJ66]MBW1603479.1 hypothetical protein [Streptomyces sp. JJ66]